MFFVHYACLDLKLFKAELSMETKVPEGGGRGEVCLATKMMSHLHWQRCGPFRFFIILWGAKSQSVSVNNKVCREWREEADRTFRFSSP